MFFTRVQLNPQRAAMRRMLESPYTANIEILKGLPGDREPCGGGRVLWRIDSRRDGRVMLYVVSPQGVDFTELVRHVGYPELGWDTRRYLPVLSCIRTGQRWEFRLTANPVRAVRLDGSVHTKPVGHVTTTQQEDWLLARTEANGFRIRQADGAYEFEVLDREIRRFKRKNTTVTLTTATYVGLLEVTDGENLRKALTQGIGRAKAYGCGMLTLAKQPQQVRGPVEATAPPNALFLEPKLGG